MRQVVFRTIALRFLALLAAFALLLAQSVAQAQQAPGYSQQELDRMLAPIALYPDALLSQILIAANYPGQVIEAARWTNDHPDLSGDDAILAAEGEDWDASVISLVAFPQVLEQMRENLQWTQSLGNAFRDQQAQTMDTVQALRRRAQAAGNLRSDDRVSLIENGPNLQLRPYDPRVIYIPYYDPILAYGRWWWPSAPPIYLRPARVDYARPATTGALYFWPPVRISTRVPGVVRHVGVRPPAVRLANTLPAPRPVPAAPTRTPLEPRRIDHSFDARVRPMWNTSTRVAPDVRPDPARTAHSVQYHARVAVRHETHAAAAIRHEPVVRHQMAPTVMPRAGFHPPPAATHTHTSTRPKPSR
ncbi:MAG: DUF3300 domain-containing protein [Proteobacteria bacterium]|nr:DUF3300 domain-containing protein [Pseudomonadota bacterium]